MRMAVILTAMVCGCASTDGVKVMWKQLPHEDLQRVCMARPTRPVVGCASPGPQSCSIYTLEVAKEKREDLHETLGHELRHCFEGAWH